MNKSKIFFYCCLFFIVGIFIRSIFSFDFFIIYLMLLIFAVFLIFSFVNKYFFILGLWILFLCLGILRFQASIPDRSFDQIFFYNQQKVEFQGIVVKEPDQRQDKVKLEISVQTIKSNGQWMHAKGKVLLTQYLFPEYSYGDKLQVVCDLMAPEPINDFAYDKYLARYDIYSLCYYPKVTLLDHGQANQILAKIYDFKSYFIGKLNRILPEPQASFLAGLLIGAKRSIPAYLSEIFNQTGTTHIIAVSGYNVTIIAAFLMLFLKNLGISRKKSFWLVIIGLVVFAIITGLQASIIRASIMGALVLLAQYLGRLNRINNALAVTAALMLLINPKILVYDLGFQLSFLATLGLVYFNPVLAKLFKIENCRFKIVKLIAGDYFLTTMSAIILTTPLILYNFGKISLVAPLANLLILPFIPLAMLLGFTALILALFYEPLGWIASWLVWFVLHYIIWILSQLANFDWAYYEFEKISISLMVFSYLIILSLIYFYRKKVFSGAN